MGKLEKIFEELEKADWKNWKNLKFKHKLFYQVAIGAVGLPIVLGTAYIGRLIGWNTGLIAEYEPFIDVIKDPQVYAIFGGIMMGDYVGRELFQR